MSLIDFLFAAFLWVLLLAGIALTGFSLLAFAWYGTSNDAIASLIAGVAMIVARIGDRRKPTTTRGRGSPLSFVARQLVASAPAKPPS